uniref:Uncharacterized protein n=1 Tax=Strombidium rassoulzadegani TaxID=1082188 RepID=A0A7S3FVR6_9SPIT|mmetsp:Transcript_3256/g.5404  ORF Transcript_3256/g.5404 Transcript_3256/m.5404 type:complete len:114 (+) Transcript_3256:1625-1966(+)
MRYIDQQEEQLFKSDAYKHMCMDLVMQDKVSSFLDRQISQETAETQSNVAPQKSQAPIESQQEEKNANQQYGSRLIELQRQINNKKKQLFESLNTFRSLAHLNQPSSHHSLHQ